MSPAQVAARTGGPAAVPVERPTRRPALRSARLPDTRRRRLVHTLSQGNLLGRIGTLTVGALFVGIFGVVVFQALLVQGQARLDHLNGQIATQQQQSKQLHLQVAQLDAPERIVTQARNDLHMVDPGDVVYLQQTPGDDARAATTPAPSAAPTTTPPPAKTTPTTTARTTPTPTTTARTTPTTAPATTKTSRP
jgi:cell division protein FtsL